MSQRRILILTNRVPFPLKDGGNLAMHTMIEGYHSAGWTVYLLSMNTTRHPVAKEQLAKLYPYLAGFDTVNIDNSLKPLGTVQNFLFSSQPNHAKRFFHSIFAKKLEAVLQSFKPEVTHFESVFLATYLPFTKEHSDAVTVLRMHNVEYQIWRLLAGQTTHRVKKLYLKNLATRIKKFETLVWKQFDLLLPITEADADVIKRSGAITDLVVAPFGIDMDNVSPSHNEQWNGYHIGAMDWIPNAEGIKWFLEDVWPQVHKAAPGFKFYFAGRGMPGTFKKMKLENVNCMGEVSDANAFIADKKILIVPLRSGGGIRVKILEAMAAGKIVICTSIAMHGIDATPGIHYLPANKRNEFAEAIKWCLQHKEDAEKMGKNATLLVKNKYGQRTIMENVISKLEAVIGSR